MKGITLNKLTPLALLIAIMSASTLLGQVATLPPEKAGKISVPLGMIAYINDNDLWVMDWDGKNQYKVVTAQNADGRVSWAPDNKRIAFTRKGSVDVKAPNHLGGHHKLYDIFIGYLDSARTNTNWWREITSTLGAKHPEWSPNDGTIIFTNDLNAYSANPLKPNYQTCLMDENGGNYEIVRSDYNDTLLFSTMPTRGPDSMYAFVLYKGFTPLGMAVTSLKKKNLSEKDIGKDVRLLPRVTAPAWSPDGKWIAYVHNDMKNQAIYITNPELTERYLIYKPTVGRNLQTYPLSWSPDSKWITFGTTDGALWIIDITGNQLRQVTGPGPHFAPAWSK
jgi:Tol biopolymer transport system component